MEKMFSRVDQQQHIERLSVIKIYNVVGREFLAFAR